MPPYNEYRFTTVRSLRQALRSLKELEQMEDESSITILLDLRQALGDTGERGAGLTRRQRHVIQLFLVENRELNEVARILNRHERVVQITVARGLKKLMQYFNGTGEPGKWQEWMVELLENRELSLEEIAKTIGKSRRAVECAVTRYRKRGRHIPYRPISRRTARV